MRSAADLDSTGTDNLNCWEARSGGGSSIREARVFGVDLARKGPMRPRYPDATRKSPMRGRNSGDFDGGIADESSRSRYVDASRKSPMRDRNLGALSNDADARKSPLRRPAMKSVTQTDSFSGWLPGEETTADQSEINKPNASPRKGRASRPELIAETGEEHGNVYGRRRAGVSYDDWVDQDGYGPYGRVRANGELRYQDGYGEVFERPRGRMDGGMRPGVRHRAPPDSYESPLNYHSGCDRRYDKLSYYNAPANLHQNVAIKQEEILRKYNELGEYIERIGDSRFNQGGRGDFYADHDDYVHDEFVRVRRGTVQSSGRHGSPRTRRGYVTDRPIPGPAVVGYNEEDVRNFHPSRFMPNEFPVHDDPCSTQLPWRTTHHEAHYYHQQFAPRRPVNPIYDPRTAENLHRPTYDLHDTKQSPVSVHDHKAHPNMQTHGRRAQDSKFHNPTPNNLSSHSKTSSDGSSIAYERAKKVLVSQNQQVCHPIAGGAPFVICSKCSQLLRLPGKLRAMKKSQCRLQCGSCRTITSFSFAKKRSHSSFQTNLKPNATDELLRKSDDKYPRHNPVAGNGNRESFDFKNTGYTFPGSDSEPSTELEDRRPNSSEGKMRPGLSPSSSNASKDDKFLEAVSQATNKEENPLTKLPLLRPPPGSPLRYHMDYSDILAANESLGKEPDASGQDAAVPNKFNLNSDEIPKTGAIEGSIDVSIGNDQGFRFHDPSLPSLNGSRIEADVYVNGQPITPDAVRSAEKLAGAIAPGTYWYDKRAGFWGLMGSHCLGIIVPFINEFKAPMPENCSGGDTSIYVNGRELHKNDLDLLSTRGLPPTRFRYYMVDISGKVEDEDTGRFVVNLGKLAPNVEKTGRGFGMQPPEMLNA